MRRLTLGAFVLLLVSLTLSPLAAQGSRPARGGDDGSSAARAGAEGRSAVPSYSPVQTYSGSSGSTYAADPAHSRGYAPTGYPGGGYVSSPNLQGTSFYSNSIYQSWNDYYFYLNRYYNLNSAYFTRFYRNREPLVTPALLKLTLRQPLFISTQMLRMIDELEIMYRDSLAGKAIDKEALIDKAQSIRKLAKVIRGNRTLALIDIRDETNVYDEKAFNALSLESVAKLREMALELNQQLADMASMSSSSTISVDSYRDPSFESISKGIEKACKAIEKSSKRL